MLKLLIHRAFEQWRCDGVIVLLLHIRRTVNPLMIFVLIRKVDT